MFINYEDMLKAGMHFGRKKAAFNPLMEKFVFTVRDGICIIDLLKTQEKIGEMIEFLKKYLAENKLILFVAATKQSRESVKTLAEKLGMPYVLDRWIGGTLTNFKVIQARVKKLEDMERQMAEGKLDKYTKKERLMFEREAAKMKERFDGLKRLVRLPDLLFVSSVKEGQLPINEAKRMHIAVTGIANTDADPGALQQVIPANDRSRMSVDLIINAIQDGLAVGNSTKE